MTEAEQPVSGFPGAWYAVFYGNGERAHWWDWLSPLEFQHVLAFGYCAHAERWLVYDVTQGRTYVRAYTTEALVSWLSGLPAHRRVLYHECDGDLAKPCWRFGFWCVPATAHLLGLRTRALRPIALYRDLVRHGATPAFERPAA